MRFSVFTPTHDTTYLDQAFKSLKAQTHTPWEWVIVPNGGAEISAEIKADPRVRVFTPPSDLGGKVGALKAFACKQCIGDYLVELDHDDFLRDDALAILSKVIDETDADFLFSDGTNFRADGTCQTFAEGNGWEYYDCQYQGRTYKAHSAFAIDAASIHCIWYAPDHVRVWRRRTYKDVGGHNPELAVCDDHELVIRTYLAGATFVHVKECLYFYRLQTDGDNTWLKRNAEIQEGWQRLSNKYVYKLAEQWSKRMGLPLVDFGGATGCPEGYQPIDLQQGPEFEVFAWMKAQKDSSVGIIRAYDFLEHVEHCKNSFCQHRPTVECCTVALMNECYRVLVPGGWMFTMTPSTDGRGAFQDPTHVSFWNSNSFWYYTRKQQQQFVPGITAKFQKVRLFNDFPTDWHKLHNIVYVYADLCALKGQRQPGLVEFDAVQSIAQPEEPCK